MKKWNRAWMMTMGMLTLAAAGCAKHTVDVQPIRVEPIHVTLDVNIRVDRELEEFFDFEQEINVHPATQPTDEMEVDVNPPASNGQPPQPTQPSGNATPPGSGGVL